MSTQWACRSNEEVCVGVGDGKEGELYIKLPWGQGHGQDMLFMSYPNRCNFMEVISSKLIRYRLKLTLLV